MQASTELTSEPPAHEPEKRRSPDLARTLVIVLAQVVVIVALAVLWQLLRSRRQAGDAEVAEAA